MLYSQDYLEQRVTNAQLHKKLVSLRLHNIYTLFGSFIAGPHDLTDFAGNGQLNTDDRPVIIFKAPQFAYTDNEPAYVRLLALMDNLNPNPNQILHVTQAADGRAVVERLTAYWAARNKFLHTGVGIKETASVEQMLHQVRGPLLSIVRESPDFEAAYYPLLTMARQLHIIKPEAARKLLIELEVANPLRQDAKKLRQYLYN